MPKAVINTSGGATVAIEGTHDEVAALLALFERKAEIEIPASAQRSMRPASKSKTSPMGLISNLIAEGFFAKPKELGAVRQVLEEQGHYYPVTTLSPLMLRLVRRKELRRIKDKKRWTYVC